MSIFNYLLFQQTKSDCGVTSLRMLAAALYQNRAILTHPMRGKLHNFSSIINGAKEMGITLRGVEILAKDEFLQIKKPFIAQLTFKDNTSHFVVLEIKRTKVKVADPGSGYYVLSYDQLKPFLTGRFLVVDNISSSKKIPKTQERYLMWPYIFNVVTIVLLLGALFFLGREKTLFLSYFFFTLSFISYISERHALMAALTTFEKKVARKVALINDSFRAQFTDVITFKELMFSFPLSRFQLLLHALLISGLLILNNIYNVMLIVLLLAIEVISERVKMRQSNAYFALNVAVSELESLPPARREIAYTQVSKQSIFLAKRKIYFTIIKNFILLLGIFSLMILTKTYSLNFLVFHYFGLLYLALKLEELTTSRTNEGKYRRAKLFFNEKK